MESEIVALPRRKALDSSVLLLRVEASWKLYCFNCGSSSAAR